MERTPRHDPSLTRFDPMVAEALASAPTPEVTPTPAPTEPAEAASAPAELYVVPPTGFIDGKYEEIQQKVYKNGAKHVYGVDNEGKKKHLSHDAILAHYGYGSRAKEEKKLAEEPVAPTVEFAMELSDVDKEDLAKLRGLVIDEAKLGKLRGLWQKAKSDGLEEDDIFNRINSALNKDKSVYDLLPAEDANDSAYILGVDEIFNEFEDLIMMSDDEFHAYFHPDEAESETSEDSFVALLNEVHPEDSTKHAAIRGAAGMSREEAEAEIDDLEAAVRRRREGPLMSNYSIAKAAEATTSEAEPDDEIDDEQWVFSALFEDEPVSSTEPVEIQGRLKRLFNKASSGALKVGTSLIGAYDTLKVGAGLAYVELGNLGSKANQYVNDPEKGGRRKLILGGLVGAVAVAGIAAAANRHGVDMPNGNGGSRVASDIPQPSGNHIQAWTDTVNSGDGITNTFMDYAQQNGVEISPQRAFDAFNRAKEAGLMTEDNISNITGMDVTGSIGFRSPGQTTLSPELLDFLNKDLGIK